MTTRVGHWKQDRCDIYVGRGAGVWGNPFVAIGKAKGSRFPVTEVRDPIAAFEGYLRERKDLLARLSELRGRVLGCWCRRLADPDSFPGHERCHGEVLARYADGRSGVTVKAIPDGGLHDGLTQRLQPTTPDLPFRFLASRQHPDLIQAPEHPRADGSLGPMSVRQVLASLAGRFRLSVVRDRLIADGRWAIEEIEAECGAREDGRDAF